MVPPVAEWLVATVCGCKPIRSTTLCLLSARWNTTSFRWRGAKLAGWIGRRGTKEWPPRSPDLTSKDFFSSSIIWSHWRPILTHIPSTTLKKISTLLRQTSHIGFQNVRDAVNNIVSNCASKRRDISLNNCLSYDNRLTEHPIFYINKSRYPSVFLYRVWMFITLNNSTNLKQETCLRLTWQIYFGECSICIRYKSFIYVTRSPKPCYGEQCCMLNTQNAMSLIIPYNPWLITGYEKKR